MYYIRDWGKEDYVKKRLLKKYFNGFAAGMLFGAGVVNATVFRVLFPKPNKKWKRKKYDAIMVCGYPALDDGRPSPEMKSRVEAAVKLWKDNKAERIIFSGGAVANSYKEAVVMAKYSESLGVMKDQMLLESESVSTYHNFLFVKKLMEEEGIKNCIVVTHGWHLRKANHYAQRSGLDYVMYAAKEGSDEILFLTWWRYVWVNLHMFFKFYDGLY